MFKYIFYINKKFNLTCSTTQVNDLVINYTINQIYINYHHVENRPAHFDGFMGIGIIYIYIHSASSSFNFYVLNDCQSQ